MFHLIVNVLLVVDAVMLTDLKGLIADFCTPSRELLIPCLLFDQKCKPQVHMKHGEHNQHLVG